MVCKAVVTNFGSLLKIVCTTCSKHNVQAKCVIKSAQVGQIEVEVQRSIVRQFSCSATSHTPVAVWCIPRAIQAIDTANHMKVSACYGASYIFNNKSLPVQTIGKSVTMKATHVKSTPMGSVILAPIHLQHVGTHNYDDEVFTCRMERTLNRCNGVAPHVRPPTLARHTSCNVTWCCVCY